MKLNNRRTILVGLAFLSICTFWQMYDSVMTLILTDTFKLNETFAGAIMAADNVLALFLLPVPLRQYNPVLWCLCSAFPTDETLFAYPLWGYYAAGSALLAVWVLLWGRVLKTKDIL